MVEALSRIEAMQQTNLMDYEEALLYQSEGYAHAQAEDYPRAVAPLSSTIIWRRAISST